MNLKFLPDTEMGNLIREKKWENTSLGPIESWPETLHNSLSIMMNSRFPMFLLWGPELLGFYNDAYRPSLGNNAMHPSILGKPAEEAWADVWHLVKKFPEQVLHTGNVAWKENQLLTIYRNGKTEDVYWTFSHSPIYNIAGIIDGIFVLCMETTQEVLATKKIAESEERFRTMAENSSALIAVGDENSHAAQFSAMADNIPQLAWMANADGWIYWYNKKWYDYTGTSAEQMEGWGWQSVHNPKVLPEVMEKWGEALAAGTIFEMTFPLKGADGKYRYFLTRVLPVKNEDGKIEKWFGTNTDVSEQQQIQSLLEYRTALWEAHNEASIDGLLLVDVKGKLISYNKRFIEIWNMPQHIVDAQDDEAALTFAMTQLVNPQQFIDKVKYLYDHPTETSTDILEYKDGKIIERYGYPVVANDGTYYAWSWTFRDITEQQTAEKKIIESEERFRALADESPIFVFVIDPDIFASVTYWNKTWLDYTGQTLEEAKGRAWNAFIHPEDVAVLMDIYSPAFEKQQNYFIPAIRVKRSDGQYRWHSFKGNPRHLPNGDFNGYVGVGFDIHENKLTEDAIKESEEKFRLLADSMPQFVWTANEKGELNYFNKAVYSYSGLSQVDVEHDGWLKIVHQDEREENIRQWVHSIKTGETFHFEHRFRRHDGEYKWQLSRAIPQRNAEGKIQMWVGTSTEIQQQKEIREQLEKSVVSRTRQLLTANDALEEKNRELEKMNKELESFTYISSHDLQEPLRKIQTFCSRILQKEKQNLTETGQDYFQRIQNSAARMQRLIEDLLAFSRSSTGERKFEIMDLKIIVEEVQNELKDVISEKRAVIETSELCKLNIIPFQFRQLVYNLISNAIKFTKQGIVPHVMIDCKIISSVNSEEIKAMLSPQMVLTEKEYCHITVKDNGIGFNPQYSERIFKVFQRLHVKNEFEGTGIGLAIVKKIVESHNGFVWATGEVGKGATFNIYIPIT